MVYDHRQMEQKLATSAVTPLRAYKLMRVRKDGTLGPLFIDARLRIPIGKWLRSKNVPTKGFAVRPGWHCVAKPYAPHLTEKGRCWFAIEITDYKEMMRPKSQGDLWYTAKRMRVLGPVSNGTI